MRLSNLRIDGEKISLRNVQPQDISELWNLRYGEENPEWKKWDAPYYEHNRPDFEMYYDQELNELMMDEAMGIYSQMVILVGEEVIGTVIFYWENEATRWLEMGITIYKPVYWQGGFGTEALSLYTEYLFSQLSEIARVGITTWSGNERMIAVGKKIGMQIEGRLRKCRYYNGQYYDSIRMGILREEWEAHKAQS